MALTISHLPTFQLVRCICCAIKGASACCCFHEITNCWTDVSIATFPRPLEPPNSSKRSLVHLCTGVEEASQWSGSVRIHTDKLHVAATAGALSRNLWSVPLPMTDSKPLWVLDLGCGQVLWHPQLQHDRTS